MEEIKTDGDIPEFNCKLKLMLGREFNIIIFTDRLNPFNSYSIKEDEFRNELHSPEFKKLRELKISVHWLHDYRNYKYHNQGTNNDCLKLLFRNLPPLTDLIISMKYVSGLFIPMRFHNLPRTLRNLYMDKSALLMKDSKLPYGCKVRGNRLVARVII